jgi:hypothetical protein
MPNFDPEKSLIHIYLGRMAFLLISFSICGACVVKHHYFESPHDKIYPITFLPSHAFHKLTYITYGIVSLYFDISVWLSITFIALVALMYCTIITRLLFTEFVARRSRYLFSNRLRTVENLVLEYRAMEVLHLNMNELIGVAIIPIQATIGQSTLFCNFLLASRWSHLDPMTKCILVTWVGSLLFLWVIGLEVAGRLNAQSLKVLGSWHFWGWSKRDKKLVLKFKKSCRSIGIRAGRYYCIKRSSVLCFIRGIVEGTFRAFCITSSEAVIISA